ncbi:MAG TPA: hypothetical protein VK939_15285 [Longimicrobiales bacterium]|nr:hypothetical protein [Longimicrobiales bacterium]
MELEVNPAASTEPRPVSPAPVRRTEHAESSLTRLLEQQAAKVPSDVFLFSGVGAMVASLALELADHPRASRFVGMWAPTLLIMGVYNKIVKLGGPR